MNRKGVGGLRHMQERERERERWLNKAGHSLCSMVEGNQVMINVLQLPLSFQ